MNIDDLIDTFLEEGKDLLDDMERSLLSWENNPNDPELINAIFRCMHTIKGNSGVFGFVRIEQFTHVAENVLVRVRDGDIQLTAELVALLLKCRDHVSTLIDLPADHQSPALDTTQEQLLEALHHYLPQEAHDVSDEHTVPENETTASIAQNNSPSEDDTWHISIRFNQDTFEHGYNPASCINYLSTLGDVVWIQTLTDAMPDAETMNPEHCYLGFELRLQSEASKTEIEAAFEFVQSFCELHILPPNSKVSDYVQLINELPENENRLGEILVACGAVTQAELGHGLKQQHDTPKNTPIGEILVDNGVVPPPVVEAALQKQQKTRDTKARTSQYVRVQAQKLDQLINLVGELVIASASASLATHQCGDAASQEAVANIAGLVEEIRDNSLQLRMVPIGETFQRFQRVVRDTAEELNKDIQLVINGAETELDKTVVEKISDPLTHLVRNAMDHGIEPSHVRLANGKPERGTLTLNACHDAGSIVIEVSDDGGGLDRDRILAKAIERNLVVPEDKLSDQEIYELIFAPGFSTAEKVTNLSGRGVGMDVVRRSIETLRGTVEVSATPGQGTQFRIRLPLTLAIIDGFLTRVNEEHYVIPLESVVECVDVNQDQYEESATRGFLNLRGEVLPVVDLREHFSVQGAASQRRNIVVARCGTQKIGVLVDRLLGEHQTVIKPLGALFKHIVGISGSTVLGNGRVALILDIPTMINHINQKEPSYRSEAVSA